VTGDHLPIRGLRGDRARVPIARAILMVPTPLLVGHLTVTAEPSPAVTRRPVLAAVLLAAVPVYRDHGLPSLRQELYPRRCLMSTPEGTDFWSLGRQLPCSTGPGGPAVARERQPERQPSVEERSLPAVGDTGLSCLLTTGLSRYSQPCPQAASSPHLPALAPHAKTSQPSIGSDHSGGPARGGGRGCRPSRHSRRRDRLGPARLRGELRAMWRQLKPWHDTQPGREVAELLATLEED